MTSWCPQTRAAAIPDTWHGSIRYGTRDEAQASLGHIIAGRDDLETRIVENHHKATHVWHDGDAMKLADYLRWAKRK